MGNIVAYRNDKDHVIHIGTKSIRPGDTREVDETLIPGFTAAKQETPVHDPAANMAETLQHSIKDLVPLLAELSNDELDLAEVVENAKGTAARKGALEAIAEERLTRTKAAQEAAEFAALLADMDDAELHAQVDLSQGDDGLQGMVAAEIEKRRQANSANG